jgi:hypothetical protein
MLSKIAKNSRIFIILLFFISGCGGRRDLVKYAFSPPGDLAFNDGRYKYPTPEESDEGWGGGRWCWQIVDGLRTSAVGWIYGLAFTGGGNNYEDTCGWRQATIDFGKDISFNRTLIFFNATNAPKHYWILACKDKSWVWDTILERKIKSYPIGKFYLNSPIAEEDTFQTVKSRKIRYTFNNCDMDHGWIFEFEVYNDKPGDRPDCLFNFGNNE